MRDSSEISSDSRNATQIQNPAAKAGRALLNWGRAVTLDALMVGVLWWIGLTLLHVPLALLWAFFAGMVQLIPHVGGVLALVGPTLSLLFGGRSWEQFGLLLCLYASIVLIDQVVLQPWLMKRTARVPIWASIFGPVVLGILIPFWGVLLAPPLLAVVFAFRKPKVRESASSPW
ncbi:MAG TPA: AI-2E family transporter [Acidobacteriaceae bacterium]|nr:AI-2E family transporter [Acidobacteriaceae bacterium]